MCLFDMVGSNPACRLLSVGLMVAYSCYRQYYPCPTSSHSDMLNYRKSDTDSSAAVPLVSNQAPIEEEVSSAVDPKLADTNV